MNFKEIRERDGLTQAQMAQKIGCSVSTVGRWETGRGAPHPLLRGYIRYLLQEPTLEWPKSKPIKRNRPLSGQAKWEDDGKVVAS